MTTLQQLVAMTTEGCWVSSGPYGAGGYPPFDAATDGLTGQQAANIPGERLNSVWAIVNHVAMVQEFTYRGLRGETPEEIGAVSAQGDTRWWPALPEEISDANWQAARQTALDNNHHLVETIAALSDSQLIEPIPSFFNMPPEVMLPHILAQLSFHVGEIITIRHMQGLWVDHLFT